MNDMGLARHAAPSGGFTFTGTWRDYAPIAFTNLLLTIVTLGIYRFWATARTRRYLWSRTEFIDDRLEWTGTGKEMFFGFLLVLAILLPFILITQFGLQALVLRGQVAMAVVLGVGTYVGILYLIGVARFRALRYRLSRTLWHGIRGGSADGGWRYGVSALWKPIAGAAALGLLVPWSMVSLWNQRWSAMSFGPHRFQAGATVSGLMGRWIALLLMPILAVIAAGFVARMIAGTGGGVESRAMATAILAVLGFYLVMAIVGLGYFAAYMRTAIGATSVGGLEFAFTARSKDWLRLFLGNLALAVVTLGIGIIFWSYRNWRFFIRHLEAYGTIDLDTLTQSQLAQTGDAEGLAAMFDVGAI